jgi:hypothetical protein
MPTPPTRVLGHPADDVALAHPASNAGPAPTHAHPALVSVNGPGPDLTHTSSPPGPTIAADPPAAEALAGAAGPGDEEVVKPAKKERKKKDDLFDDMGGAGEDLAAEFSSDDDAGRPSKAKVKLTIKERGAGKAIDRSHLMSVARKSIMAPTKTLASSRKSATLSFKDVQSLSRHARHSALAAPSHSPQKPAPTPSLAAGVLVEESEAAFAPDAFDNPTADAFAEPLDNPNKELDKSPAPAPPPPPPPTDAAGESEVDSLRPPPMPSESEPAVATPTRPPRAPAAASAAGPGASLDSPQRWPDAQAADSPAKSSAQDGPAQPAPGAAVGVVHFSVRETVTRQGGSGDGEGGVGVGGPLLSMLICVCPRVASLPQPSLV